MSIVALAVAGCGDDEEETTVTETETVIETNVIPRPDPPPTTAEPTETEPSETAEDEPEADSGGAVTAPAHCGRIAFQKNTDSGAIAITGVGVDCSTAKAVAQAAQGRSDDLRYETNGFECVGIRRSQAALASVDWTCVRGDDFIRFGTT